MASIAGLTNMERFHADLKRILVPRIVNTPQHRQVGEVSGDEAHARQIATLNICSSFSTRFKRAAFTPNGTIFSRQRRSAQCLFAT